MAWFCIRVEIVPPRLSIFRVALAALPTLLLALVTPALAQEIRAFRPGLHFESHFILIDGEIEPGFVDRFERFLASGAGAGDRVRLNSPGGSLVEGIALGLVLREHGFRTEVGDVEMEHIASIPEGYEFPREVPGHCASACALAFLGGVERQPSCPLAVSLDGRCLAYAGLCHLVIG